MYRKVLENKRHRVKLSCLKPSYAVHLLEYAFGLFHPTAIGSYAAFDHLTLNFHQALEYNLFMAFTLNFAAVRQKPLLLLGIK